MNKPTDNEIKKALECCVKDDILEADNKACLECPMNDDNACTFNLRKYTLNLINRQQAEIERLKNCVKSEDEVMDIAKRTMEPLVKEITREQIDIAVKLSKTEAIKEFAERLKTEFSQYQREYRNVLNDEGACAMIIAKKGVDNLLKELVGEQE